MTGTLAINRDASPRRWVVRNAPGEVRATSRDPGVAVALVRGAGTGGYTIMATAEGLRSGIVQLDATK
jgi:hypothetical protein